nr:uncharacterized protein LOC127316241 [Lolium perenne]
MARFFSSLPEVAAAETVMSGAAALWSSAARRSPEAEPLPAPPATAEPLPAPPATAAPRDAHHGRAPAPPSPAHHGRARAALARQAEPHDARPVPCLAARRAPPRPLPRRPRRAPPRPRKAAPPSAAPTTPRASPRAPVAAPARTPAAAAAAWPRRGPRGGEELACRTSTAAPAPPSLRSPPPRRLARSPPRAAPARTLLDVEVPERGARGGCSERERARRPYPAWRWRPCPA